MIHNTYDIQEDDPIVFDHYGDSTLAKAYRRLETTKELYPYYNALSLLKWRWTFNTPYGQTDGRYLRLNPHGVMEKIEQTSDPVGHLAFLLAHEAGHVMLGISRLFKLLGVIPEDDAPAHVLNEFMKRKRLVNIAADHADNLLILKQNAKLLPIIEGSCCDIRFDNMSTENILIELVKEENNGQSKMDDEQGEEDGEQQDGEQDGDDNPQPSDEGDEPCDEDADTNQDTSESDSDGDSTDEEGDGGSDQEGDATGGTPKPTDKEILGDDWVGQGADDLPDKPHLEEGEALEEVLEESEQISDQVIKQSEIAAASSDMGLSNTLRSVKDQKSQRSYMDWKKYVMEWNTARIADGWTRPFNAPIFNATNGLCTAGRGRDGCGTIVYVIDSSWSMDEQLTSDLLILAQEFLDNMRPEKMVILSVSSQVRDVYELYAGDTAPSKIIVGGGTRFHPAFEWVKENEPFCDGLVYLTDGYSNDVRNLQEQPYPVLWVSYGLESKHFPIGEAIDAPPSNAGIAA